MKKINVSEGAHQIRLSNEIQIGDFTYYQAFLNKFKDINNYRLPFQSPRSNGDNK